MRRNLSKDDVPLLFQEPHIEFGYRPLHQSWTYYLMSVFSLHNESMNVWTHLIASIFVGWKIYIFSKELDFIGDCYTWPLLAGMICGLLMYALSSFAHCCQSKSEFVHYVSFMIDYSGIGLYGLGSVILHQMYCTEDDFYYFVSPFYVPVAGILAFLICFCCTFAKVKYKRPYPMARKVWQMTPVAVEYVWLISPIIHRLISCYVYGLDCNESIKYHVRQIFFFVLSAVFFASNLPQKWHPGKFDYFMHSHSIFHIAIAISILTQIDGVMVDFQTRESTIRNRPAPTFFSAFGPIILVLVSEVIFIVYYAHKVHKKLCPKQSKQK